RPRSPVEPIYMPGRLRTASSPLRTWISLPSYSWSVAVSLLVMISSAIVSLPLHSFRSRGEASPFQAHRPLVRVGFSCFSYKFILSQMRGSFKQKARCASLFGRLGAGQGLLGAAAQSGTGQLGQIDRIHRAVGQDVALGQLVRQADHRPVFLGIIQEGPPPGGHRGGLEAENADDVSCIQDI